MAIVLFQRETLLPLSMQQCQQKSFINIIAPFLRIKHHNHGTSTSKGFIRHKYTKAKQKHAYYIVMSGDSY